MHRISRQAIIVYGILGLLALLPINHFITQVGINILGLPAVFLLWKELVISVIAGVMIWDILYSTKPKKLLWLYVFSALCALALISSRLNSITFKDIALGFRVELFWVGFLATSLAWLQTTRYNLLKHLGAFQKSMGIGLMAVSLLTFGSIVFGAQSFYSVFGYSNSFETSDGLVLESPICHSIDTLGDGCRLTGGFATPNNYAGYLLLIVSLVLWQAFGAKELSLKKKIIYLVVISWVILCIVLSYARFAYVGLALLLAASLYNICILKIKKRSTKKAFRKLYYLVSLIPFMAVAIFLLIGPEPIVNSNLPTFITKPGSTLDHFRRTRAGLDIITREFPHNIVTGYGLGQAGPIGKPQYKDDILQTPIVENNLDISAAYEIPPHELPVPENWFVQLVLNGGVIYGAGYILLVTYPLWSQEAKKYPATNLILLAGILSILFGNTLLHVWENLVISFYYIFVIMLITSIKNSESS